VKARTAWLLTLPILLVSETIGHALTARLFAPERGGHGLLLRALEDYVEYAHAALAIVLVVVGAVLVRRALASFRDNRPRPLPSWRLAAIPSAAFLLQEQFERLLSDGDAGSLTAVEPTVLVGVVLQLPCGLLALWLVRTLLRAADEVGCALARRNTATAGVRAQSQRWLSAPVSSLRPPALASRHAGRAPPSLA
jgi:hypothetical protein